MREITKQEFKELYLRHGTISDGWGQDYWNKFFEPDRNPKMKYFVNEPETSAHTRMMIVNDYGCLQHRMFFASPAEEERLFSTPG